MSSCVCYEFGFRHDAIELIGRIMSSRSACRRSLNAHHPSLRSTLPSKRVTDAEIRAQLLYSTGLALEVKALLAMTVRATPVATKPAPLVPSPLCKVAT